MIVQIENLAYLGILHICMLRVGVYWVAAVHKKQALLMCPTLLQDL